MISDPSAVAAQRDFHLWYYATEVWDRTTFLGVPCMKAVTDLWNYQEILAALRPHLIVEFGTYVGGSALFFAEIARLINPAARVITVDRKVARIDDRVAAHPGINVVAAETTASVVAETIAAARAATPGPLFAILDSNHTKAHVLAELELLRPLTIAGDYVVVEDTNMNGHPVVTDFGEGPMEAVVEYQRLHPNDYVHDRERETKFGLTFAPNGYLIRQ
jgi:cephalosporin hydroxylase